MTQAPTPAPAPPVSPPSPAPPPTPAPAPAPGPAPAGPNCTVTSGPTYSPTSPTVSNNGRRKQASFSMAATFGSASGAVPRCCGVRQYIRWNSAYQTANGGPPHRGFPATASAGTWYEDRDTADKRYGHRSGPYSDPIASCGDEYLSGTARDMANGDTYCGKDNPFVPARITGAWDFQLKVVDVEHGSAEKASSPIITITWG
jgi:hypothetical protein